MDWRSSPECTALMPPMDDFSNSLSGVTVWSAPVALQAKSRHMLTSPSHIHAICHLRLHIAVLGERLSPPWWRTEFLSPTGLRIVQRLFPRIYLAAALESATVAARRDHDANIGRRSFHLFRLSAHMEHQLADLTRFEGAFADSTITDAPPQLIEMLEALALPAATWVGTGPRLVGSVNDISKPMTIGRLASLYAYAARKGERVYPYFEAVDHA